MNKYIKTIFLLFLSSSMLNFASADWVEKNVVYECNSEEKLLSIWLFYGESEPPKIPFSLENKKVYSPGDLIEQDPTVVDTSGIGAIDDYVRGKTVVERCIMAKHEYMIWFSGIPGNPNVTRRCGATSTINIEIERDGMPIFNGNLEPDCLAFNIPSIKKIKVIEGDPVTVQITNKIQE